MNYREECSAFREVIVYRQFLSTQAWYFDRDDVALPGVHEFFKLKSAEEREHAEKLMAYQNMRGGRIVLQTTKVGIYYILYTIYHCFISHSNISFISH